MNANRSRGGHAITRLNREGQRAMFPHRTIDDLGGEATGGVGHQQGELKALTKLA